MAAENVIASNMRQTALEASQAVPDSNAPPEADAAAHTPAAGPEPPPSKTADEIWADLKSCPLFMTDLEGQEENDGLAALQALAYEGTPLENASDFKDRGNEEFVDKRWQDAREFYTKGIDVLVVEERKRSKAVAEAKAREFPPAANAAAQAEDLPAPPTPPPPSPSREPVTQKPTAEDSPEEIAKQRAVLARLYANRAACHLYLGNYRSCTLDCGAALRLEPRNAKALYRSARALLAVDRTEEALDACRHGLAVDPDNAALKATAAEVRARAEALGRRAGEKAEREATARRRATLLRAALRARGIRTRTTDKPPDMEDAGIRLVPDPDDAERSSLAFPAVLLYPVHYESDFIKAFGEGETLLDHLSYVLPPPWDRAGEYTVQGAECYVETAAGGLMKIGKRVPLGKVLGTGKVEVVDEVARVFVLPGGRTAKEWVATHKEALAKRNGRGAVG